MLETLLDQAAELESQLAAFVYSRPAHRRQDWHRAYWMLDFLTLIRPHVEPDRYTRFMATKAIRELEIWCNCASEFASTLPLSQEVLA